MEKAVVFFNDTMAEDQTVLVGLMRGFAAKSLREALWRLRTSKAMCWISTAISAGGCETCYRTERGCENAADDRVGWNPGRRILR